MVKRLEVGDSAPSFLLNDVNDVPVSLSDMDSKYILIAFLRYAGCPWCNLAIHRLAMEHPLLRDSNCEVLAFIQSSKQNIKSNIYDRHALTPSFPIIPDHSMNTYKTYGVKPSIKHLLTHDIINIPSWVKAVSKEGFGQKSVDGNLFLAPAMFLVSPGSRTIIRADYNADLYDHASFTDIYETIAKHQLYGSDTIR